VTDLLGNEIAYEQAPTRRWRNLREAVAWSADIVSAALDGGQTRLRRVVVAVPARAINGQVVARLPLFMSAIEGPEFGGLLMERLGCSVRIETDAAMILAGLEALRLLDRGSFPVLLNLGSVLTMSLRRADGTIAEGRSSSFGDFGLIPVETDLGRFRIGGLLGAHGLFEASRGLGRELPAMEDLWRSDSEDVRRLGRAFAVALEHAVRVIVVMSDPSEIVFTGRLVPLVERSLDVLERQLKAEVDQPPTLRIVDYAEEGHAAAVGAADEARAGATAELLERIAREGIEALR
jgi:predicted NBD/HSP70 family sugar kinase